MNILKRCFKIFSRFDFERIIYRKMRFNFYCFGGFSFQIIDLAVIHLK